MADSFGGYIYAKPQTPSQQPQSPAGPSAFTTAGTNLADFSKGLQPGVGFSGGQFTGSSVPAGGGSATTYAAPAPPPVTQQLAPSSAVPQAPGAAPNMSFQSLLASYAQPQSNSPFAQAALTPGLFDRL